MPYVLWYWVRYAVTGLLAWLGLGMLASGLVAGGGTGLAAAGAAVLAGAVAVAAASARSHARSRRVHDKRLRRQLLALIRQRAAVGGRSLWLNRDEHWLFSAYACRHGLLRRWVVSRWDEDQVAGAVLEAWEGGRTAVTAEYFTVLLTHPAVQREADGAVAEAGSTGEPEAQVPAPLRRDLRWHWRRLQSFRAGHLFATPDELRDLISQFRAAELIRPDGPYPRA